MSLARRAAGQIALALALALVAAACGDGATKYDVRIGFNESVTQAGMDEVADLLRAYDDDLDFLVQESFPPTGVATLKTDVADFCPTIEPQLKARSDVREVTCNEHRAADEDVTPDEPVASTPAQ